MREAKGGGDFVPLAPTAQVSEQLPSAGIFRDGTATEAPKSTKIVRDLREVPKMAKTEMIRARVEPELKSQAEEVFSGLGLSPTAAITLFYRQVTLHHGLPFAVKVPNAGTIAALRQARTGEGLTEYTSLEDLKARHG